MAQKVSTRKIIGALMAFVPIPLIVTVLAGYAIGQFILKDVLREQSGLLMTGLVSGRFLLGIMGIVALVGIICIPIGIYLLVKRDSGFLIALRRSSLYTQMPEEQLAFVTGPSFGAFLNPFVWAMGNHLYWWAMGMFIPFWGMYVWVRMIVDGRRLSYEKGWDTFTHFQQSQKTLLQVIGIMLLIQLVIPVIFFMLSAMIPALLLSGFRSSVSSTTRQTSTESSSLVTNSTGRSCIFSKDTDHDLLSDFDEKLSFYTDEQKADTDGDGFDDFSELLRGYDAGSTNGKVMTDTDSDGVTDAVEKKIFKSDYKLVDTDGDGIPDGDEVKNGVNPAATGETLDVLKEARVAEYATYEQQCAQN